jgi:3-aminobutyryl-CoA ammonia-lyase
VGTRSRLLELEARVVCRGAEGDGGPSSAAVVLDPPLVAVTANGTVVVPAPA